MSALEYWLWLSAADVSPRAKAALVDRFGDAERAFLAPKGAFSRIPGVLQKEAQILERRDKSMAAQIVKDCARQGLEILTLQDAHLFISYTSSTVRQINIGRITCNFG
ncbi:MAG: hypothetical protein IK095_08690, partial [Oscillospiraceae bacterium]|nr:hypothetical protein [Oscillospiraceae bacterium]